jgi:hypothetical protein
MKKAPKPVSTRPTRSLEHISINGPEGETRFLRFVSRDKSNLNGSRYELDWWRTPVRPKGLGRRLMEAARARLRVDL